MSKVKDSDNAKFSWNRVINGIMAISMTLIIASMAWSAYTIWNGLEGKLPKIMIAPQVLFTLYLISKAFMAKGTK